MRKIFIITVLSFFSLMTYSQEKNNTSSSETKSKAIEYLEKNGMFVSKEFYNIGKVKGIDCQVLILSDLVSKDKIGCLRLETTKYVSSYKSIETYRGTLDFEEIGDCLKCLYYLKDNILMSMPNVYTEVEYKSRDGVRFGAYFNEKKSKWQAFVYTKSYNTKSAEYVDSANIEELINFLETSQKVISEKTQ